MSSSVLPVVSLLVLFACGQDKDGASDEGGSGGSGGETPAADPVCALPAGSGEIAMGDANHDARVDVSDGVWTLRHLLNAGAAPACTDAQDLLKDGLVDIADGQALFYSLFTGIGELPDRSPDCETPTAIADVECGVLELGLDVADLSAAAGESTTAAVGVLLRSPDLDVQAWSFGVTAEGCTLTGASEGGTVIADVRLDDQGRRDMGWTRSDALDGGLTHSGVLSWRSDVVLSAREEAWRLVQLDLSLTAPASGCDTCTLAFTDTLAVGESPAVAVVVTAGGRSYTPTATGASFEICAN